MASNDPTSAVTHPRFMGMRGRTLDLMVSFIATTGFLLFGYDRKYSICANNCCLDDLTNFYRGRYVWNHIRGAFQ